MRHVRLRGVGEWHGKRRNAIEAKRFEPVISLPSHGFTIVDISRRVSGLH